MNAVTSASVQTAPQEPVEIRVVGMFCVRLGDGSTLTPRPQKARALLALLALSPEYRRSRQWLIERLWSDRSPEQASGSLRQALVDLRKAFGAHADILLIDRETVSLSTERVHVVRDGPPEQGFLEDIAVRDPAFREWRSIQARLVRSHHAEDDGTMRAARSEDLPVNDALIMIGWGATGANGSVPSVVAEILASRIARSVSEQIPAVTISMARDQLFPAGAPDIEVSCSVIEDNGICLAFIKITHFTSGRVLFAKDFRITGTASSLVGSLAVDRAIVEAAEKTAGSIPHVMGARRNVTQSTALGQLALHKLFTFDRGHLLTADRLLEQAYDLHESSVFLAWRGLLQMIKSIEMPDARTPQMRDMADELSRYATERAPSNATVSALASQTRAMLFGDAGGALHFAARAMNDNPQNPLAIQAMAVAKMLAGENEDSYHLSAMARSYVGTSAFRHWWDAHHCTICVATGRKDEAISTGEMALRNAASLRPIYRYLIALHADRGDLARADVLRIKLEQLEPGFTLDQMINDPDYPVRTLRNAGLIGAVRKLQ